MKLLAWLAEAGYELRGHLAPQVEHFTAFFSFQDFSIQLPLFFFITNRRSGFMWEELFLHDGPEWQRIYFSFHDETAPRPTTTEEK